MKKNRKSFLIGFILGVAAFLLCAYTSYKVNFNEVYVKTVVEESHKYVVATITNTSSSTPAGVSIIHSENCWCKNK